MNHLASLGTVCGEQRIASLCDLDMPAVAPDRRATTAVGGQCQTKIVIDFVLWVGTRCNNFPTAQQVQDRFNVSRATAYRWRRCLADALGLSEVPTSRFQGLVPDPFEKAQQMRGAGVRA